MVSKTLSVVVRLGVRPAARPGRVSPPGLRRQQAAEGWSRPSNPQTALPFREKGKRQGLCGPVAYGADPAGEEGKGPQGG